MSRGRALYWAISADGDVDAVWSAVPGSGHCTLTTRYRHWPTVTATPCSGYPCRVWSVGPGAAKARRMPRTKCILLVDALMRLTCSCFLSCLVATKHARLTLIRYDCLRAPQGNALFHARISARWSQLLSLLIVLCTLQTARSCRFTKHLLPAVKIARKRLRTYKKCSRKVQSKPVQNTPSGPAHSELR